MHLQVHSAGLKLGVYLSLGNVTQHGYPGTDDHKEQDVSTLVSWGIDMVFVDAVNVQQDSLTQGQSHQLLYSFTY